MTDKKIDYHALTNEIFKLMLQYDKKKDISGIMKKSLVIKIIKTNYKLTEDQIELIDKFIDVVILFYKVHKTTGCFKCF